MPQVKNQHRRNWNDPVDPGGPPIQQSMCVDASWSPTTKEFEYRGLWLNTRTIAFASEPIADGTVNLGEFLAIIDGLRMLQREGLNWPIYSDSAIAICWYRKRAINSGGVYMMDPISPLELKLADAMEWLRESNPTNPVLKWETAYWGENPADYGRKWK